MGEAENQDSMQLSEELQFVTACLIGHHVKIQTTSFLFHGIFQAANFEKDYGVVLNVAGKDVDHGNIKIFLRDIVYISAENVSLDLDKDAMFEICTKGNHCKVVACVALRCAGQSAENTKATEQHATSIARTTNIAADQKSAENNKATEQHATSIASSTNIVADQKGSYSYPLNSNSQPMMPIMQPAPIDNRFQGVQVNSQPLPMSVSYQPPSNYGVQWHYPRARGQIVAYVHPPYPQASQPIQGYVPHQVQGYPHQPQYPPGPQNFDSSYQDPRGY